jgi:hypothetical protein
MLLLGGIWWWGNRRPTQARGRAELREAETTGNFATTVVAEDAVTLNPDLPGSPHAAFPAHPIVREPAISPYEPLRISAQEAADPSGEFDLPVMVEPAVDSQAPHGGEVRMLADAGAADPGLSTTLVPIERPREESPPAAGPAPGAPAAAASDSGLFPSRAEPRAREVAPRDPVLAPRTDTSGRFSRVKPPEVKLPPAKPVELQKIITVRVCAAGDAAWDGTDLATAFAGSDLVHGRYGVFHRLHADGRSIFCVASLMEPGSFDPARMPEQRFPGVSIFAVLPGPVEPLQTFEQLMAAARQLAQDLSGMMQDEKGGPLSPQRAGSLREEVIRFQQKLQAEAAH